MKDAKAHTWYSFHALLKEKAAGLNFMAPSGNLEGTSIVDTVPVFLVIDFENG